MLNLFLALALLPAYAFPAPILDPSSTYAVKKELTGTGSAQKPLEHYKSEMKSNLESYDLTSGRSQLLLTNRTEQLFSLRTLPRDPKNPGPEGLDHAVELTFEKLRSSSEVYINNMPKPFVTDVDLGSVLAKTPLTLRGDGKTQKKVEGLAAAREAALGQVKGQIARNTITGLLDESVLLRTSSSAATGGCLGGLDGKKIGDKWDFTLNDQGARLEYACEFKGWAESGGQKIAVIAVTLKKSRQTRQQPNGTEGIAETSGSGHVYFVPGTQESLMNLDTEVMAEPMSGEIERFKARGEKVPRNKTIMKMWSRLYGI